MSVHFRDPHSLEPSSFSFVFDLKRTQTSPDRDLVRDLVKPSTWIDVQAIAINIFDDESISLELLDEP